MQNTKQFIIEHINTINATNMKDRKRLEEYLIRQTDGYAYSESEIKEMSDYELFDAWLRWEGIIGWTDTILRNVRDVFGVEINI